MYNLLDNCLYLSSLIITFAKLLANFVPMIAALARSGIAVCRWLVFAVRERQRSDNATRPELVCAAAPDRSK